ncbi:hypothetical protein LLG95_11850 [bacterium]|nr:hypothetical protein [bacterium]
MVKSQKQSSQDAREPLLAGVEDNPVYRLLRKWGNWRRSNFQVNHRSGIDQLFNFHDWVWDDLDATPLTARDYAQALWATTVEPAGKGQIAYLVFLAFLIAAHCVLNCYGLAKNSAGAGSAGYLMWAALLGYQYYASREPASKLPALIKKASNSKSVFSQLFGLYSSLFYCGFFAILILGCEIGFVFIPAKNMSTVLLKYISGAVISFGAGWTSAWVYLKYLKPSRMLRFEELVTEIDFLLKQRRRNRDGESEPAEAVG